MTAKSYKWTHPLAALLLLSNLAAAREPLCSAQPPAGFDQPPNQARHGRYINPVYGYAVDIPATLTGYVQTPGPERGFGIVLSWAPRAFLRVDASYDALFDLTAQGVHRSDLGVIRQHDTVLDDQQTPFRLANHPGMRFVTRVQCEGNAALFIHEAVIVMLNREIYRLDLQTVPERYVADVKILKALLRSWRWEKIQPAQ